MAKLSGVLEKVTFDTESGRTGRPYRVTIEFGDNDLTWDGLVGLALCEIKRIHARKVGRGWSDSQLERALRDGGGTMNLEWNDLVGRSQRQAGPNPAELLAQVHQVSPLSRDQAWALARGWGMEPQAFEAWWRQNRPAADSETEPGLPTRSPWFAECRTAEAVRERYRRLAKIYHPDRGGSGQTMTQINREFEAAKRRFGLA